MKITLKNPSQKQLQTFLNERKGEAISYNFPKATLNKDFPIAYDHDRNSCHLGRGEAVWQAAKEAIDSWVMFPKPWTRIYPGKGFKAGEEVVVLFHLFGVKWFNSCRVQYVIDEADRYGFAYGTLLNHVESGEELFCVEKDEKGNVTYHIQAFSRPRFWLAKIGKPISRMYQRKFVRESKQAMQDFVKHQK